MPNWRDTLKAREAGHVPGFQAHDETNQAFTERLAREAHQVDAEGRPITVDEPADVERERRQWL